MSLKAFGNTKGLKPSELKRLEKLFYRRLDRTELLSLELARELFNLATELRRRIGVLVNREGHVIEVCVGTKDILYIPDLGRYRLGPGRLRRVRLIFSDLSTRHKNEVHIPHDIYTDLEKLRLDAVVGVKIEGNRTCGAFSHLAAGAEGSQVSTEQIRDLAGYSLDFNAFLSDLESELERSSFGLNKSLEQRALLVGVYDKGFSGSEASMRELEELARTAGVKVAGKVVQMRKLDPRTLVGKGKLEEIVLRSLAVGAELLIFDRELKPAQWRVITNSTELKVIDRSMLILDIFAQRAKSSEGRLQVELAQLKYSLPRLVEKDTGLSRLTGGIGGRGPGETKLEIGRRRIRDRISELENRIGKMSRDRGLRRKRRQADEIPQVSILGYTNVGKSTLFNALTNSTVLVENKLFATLDPVQRQLFIRVPSEPNEMPNQQFTPFPEGVGVNVILSDTVGFIRDLPDELKTAFRATLEELHQASLLLHVLDASDKQLEEHKTAVEQILKELELAHIPTLNVLNKCDLVSSEKICSLVSQYEAIAISAQTAQGLKSLVSAIGLRVQSVAAKAEAAAEI